MIYGNYLIRDNGTVFNIKTNKEIKLSNHSKGYKKVTLYVNGVAEQHFVHRLVAMGYVSGDKDKNQVNHIDGDKTNNHYSNLEWVDNSENQIHAHKIGLKKSGKDVWNGKFSKEDIELMKDYDEQGMKRVDIARLFECSKSTVSEVLNGNRYKH